MECAPAVLNFVQDLLAQKGDQEPFATDSPLFSNGRLQSIDGIQVALFLEDRFGVDFASMGFEQEKIDTVESICALVAWSQPRQPLS